jgi:signal peptidase I
MSSEPAKQSQLSHDNHPVIVQSHVKKQPKQPKESWKSIASTIAILLIAPLFALFLITFVFQSYLVDGPSMETTLQDKDRLIVWKMPRTWARITGNEYIPDRSDIIVFTEPKLVEFGQKSSKQLIKRVVGLPGERVVIKDGIVTVYNADHPDGFEFDVKLPDGSSIESTSGELDTTVPDGSVFVLGDNRSNSLDSRAFGPVEANNIVGKLTARFLPLGEARHF